VIEGSLGEADHLGADADAALVEGLDGDLVPLADLAEHVLRRDEAILEDQLAGARRADPELVLLLAEGEARKPLLDEEGGDALVTLGRVDRREDDEEGALGGVGDPQLAAVEDPAPLLALGPRPERERVGAGALLAERVGADPGAAHLRQEAGLLLLVRPAQQGVEHERVLHVDEHRDARIDGRQRLDRQDRVEERAARAAVAVRDLDAHQAQLEEARQDRRIEGPLLVHVGDVAGDAVAGVGQHRVAEHRFFLGEARERGVCHGPSA
jgi:hypothetical protein